MALGEALIELSDIANCASNDFHCMHFDVVGLEFDTIHKKVLKNYYEEAAEDFDEFAEKARMFGVVIPNPSKSAERVDYPVFEHEGTLTKDECVQQSNAVMDIMLEAYVTVFKVANKESNCPMTIGVANYLQTRIEFWSKERYYFNASRGGANVNV